MILVGMAHMRLIGLYMKYKGWYMQIAKIFHLNILAMITPDFINYYGNSKSNIPALQQRLNDLTLTLYS